MKNPFEQKSFIRFLSIFALVLAVSWGCNDENKTPSLISINNPNDVARSLAIENSTYLSGNPPAPTNSETAPVLYNFNDGQSLFSIQGSKIIVNTSLESGSASGFYVQINGADGYYKINSTTASGRLGVRSSTSPLFNGRKQEGDAAFSIEIPENLQPGEFCISYCVYDPKNQVSNIIEQCITVTSLGGGNSNFLTSNVWDYWRTLEFENDILVGGDTVDIAEYYMYQREQYCNGEYITQTITEEDVTDYLYLTFTPNGGLLIEQKYIETYLDRDNSDCEPLYQEVVVSETFTGSWSYNDADKTLIILYNVPFEGGVETFVVQFQVNVVNNQLILTNQFEDNSYDETYFNVKN